MAHPMDFVVGESRVWLRSTQGLNRIITDFDSNGAIEVLTLVTQSGVWRVFSDGTTHGTKPFSVTLSTSSWKPDTTTRPDLPWTIKKPGKDDT